MSQDDPERTPLLNGFTVAALKRRKPSPCNSATLHRFNGFALYEVLLGVTIFAVGVLALGRAVDERLAGSLAAVCHAVSQGAAQVIRVHDVAATRDAVRLLAAVLERQPPP